MLRVVCYKREEDIPRINEFYKTLRSYNPQELINAYNFLSCSPLTNDVTLLIVAMDRVFLERFEKTPFEVENWIYQWSGRIMLINGNWIQIFSDN